MTAEQIEKLHQLHKAAQAADDEKDFDDDICFCSVHSNMGVQLYHGIEELAKHWKETIYTVPFRADSCTKLLVHDGLQYFQLIYSDELKLLF